MTDCSGSLFFDDVALLLNVLGLWVAVCLFDRYLQLCGFGVCVLLFVYALFWGALFIWDLVLWLC